VIRGLFKRISRTKKEALVATTPRWVREETAIREYGKRVLRRVFAYPQTDEHPEEQCFEFLLWGVEADLLPVTIFPLTASGEVVAVQQFRQGANTVVLEFPGGLPEHATDKVEHVVTRELQEETGFSPGRIITLAAPLWFDPAACTTSFLPVLALDCVESAISWKRDRTEIIDVVRPLPALHDWARLIRSGGVRDSKTIAVTYLALEWLKENRPDVSQ
jgi:8-oxo-dGTP pyrophosphatase MutT (NUDIX family)